ncbi:tyrosine-protein kinase Fyn [Striga asiatica]|uniref:Tyrosine-protein kinase Fyn n=1 Tax=Striga asiatica TaxID=4170 RepID=A0A5A7RAH6_STRAF|nr:tyrosine-protein kinase Fyn [Striga asiatica]
MSKKAIVGFVIHDWDLGTLFGNLVRRSDIAGINVKLLHCPTLKPLRTCSAYRLDVVEHTKAPHGLTTAYYVPTTRLVLASVSFPPNILAMPKSDIFGFRSLSSNTLLALRSLCPNPPSPSLLPSEKPLLQFLKHTSLHSFKLKLSLNQVYLESGNLIPEYLKNTSSLQFNSLLLTHPLDQSDLSQLASSFGTNLSRQPQTG